MLRNRQVHQICLLVKMKRKERVFHIHAKSSKYTHTNLKKKSPAHNTTFALRHTILFLRLPQQQPKECKQTHTIHITSIFCFPSFATVKSICLFFQMNRREVLHNKQASKQTHSVHVTSIHLLLPKASKPSKANLSLLSDEQGKGLPQQRTREQTNSQCTYHFHFHFLLPKLRNRQVNLSLLSDEKEKGLPQEQTREQTNSQNKFTSIFCFPCFQKPSSSDMNSRRRREGLPNTNKQEQTNSRNKSLHLPSSASCASKPSKADLSLHSDEQEKVFHIQGLPQEKTREQTNPQNKSLPSSASHASKPSKPIYLFIQ